MKVCTWAEFAALPAGTIFSFWEPAYATGLHVKGETWDSAEGKPIDFLIRDLLPVPQDANLGSLNPNLDQDYGRWGMFQFDQLFAVYKSDDLDALHVAILEAKNLEYKTAAELGGEG